MLKPVLSALAISAATALSAWAQDVPARGEILQGWLQADGTRVAAIRIRMAPGWKTYWRSPGEAGIPPHFDWSRSRNLRGVGITWPAPKVYPQNGMNTIGYKDELVLPLTIAPRNAGKPVRLKVALDIGVCRDICVPFEMTLTGDLETSSTTPTPAIAAALADRAYSAREGGVRSATCAIRPTSKGMEITARLSMPHKGGREHVVIEPGQPGLWMSETDTARAGNTLTATGDLIASGGGAVALDRSAITITVIGQTQVVEIRGCDPA